MKSAWQEAKINPYIPDGMIFAEGSTYKPLGNLFIQWERKYDATLSIRASYHRAFAFNTARKKTKNPLSAQQHSPNGCERIRL